MRKCLIIILVICVVLSTSAVVQADSYYEGRREGERIADNEHSTLPYWAAGIPASFFLSPLIGGTGTIAAAYLMDPNPESGTMTRLSDEHSEDYLIGFEEGFTERAKSRNVRAAWGATGIGFGARLILVLATMDGANSSQDDYIPAFEIKFSF